MVQFLLPLFGCFAPHADEGVNVDHCLHVSLVPGLPLQLVLFQQQPALPEQAQLFQQPPQPLLLARPVALAQWSAVD